MAYGDGIYGAGPYNLPALTISRPKRFIGPILVSDTAVTGYTTPAATVAVPMHVHVYNASALPATITVSIGADSAPTRILDGIPIPAHSNWELAGRDVMSENEVIQYFADTDGVLTLTVSGEEWTAE